MPLSPISQLPLMAGSALWQQLNIWAKFRTRQSNLSVVLTQDGVWGWREWRDGVWHSSEGPVGGGLDRFPHPPKKVSAPWPCSVGGLGGGTVRAEVEARTAWDLACRPSTLLRLGFHMAVCCPRCQPQECGCSFGLPWPFLAPGCRIQKLLPRRLCSAVGPLLSPQPVPLPPDQELLREDERVAPFTEAPLGRVPHVPESLSASPAALATLITALLWLLHEAKLDPPQSWEEPQQRPRKTINPSYSFLF